jgi:Tat protein secretion system quality control protein TatD with DNase activity
MKALERLLPDLPEPILLSDVLITLRAHLTDFPNAMLGEVGLDRSFRIPWSPDPNIQRKLSDFTVPLEHQIHILEAQLKVAVELKRNVSFHSVKAQQATLQLVDRMSKQHGEAWDMISIDIHSCGLSPEMWITLEVI